MNFYSSLQSRAAKLSEGLLKLYFNNFLCHRQSYMYKTGLSRLPFQVRGKHTSNKSTYLRTPRFLLSASVFLKSIYFVATHNHPTKYNVLDQINTVQQNNLSNGYLSNTNSPIVCLSNTLESNSVSSALVLILVKAIKTRKAFNTAASNAPGKRASLY